MLCVFACIQGSEVASNNPLVTGMPPFSDLMAPQTDGNISQGTNTRRQTYMESLSQPLEPMSVAISRLSSGRISTNISLAKCWVFSHARSSITCAVYSYTGPLWLNLTWSRKSYVQPGEKNNRIPFRKAAPKPAAETSY